jgi:hypothetical protein
MQLDNKLLPTFHRLTWNLDVQVANEAIRNQSDVQVLLQFNFNHPGQSDSGQTVTLSCSPAQVHQLTQQLENCLIEAKNSLHKFTFHT